MRRAWLVLRRALVWSYERGSWPYDVMVVAILVFVLLSPRGWFRDQPRVGPAGHRAEITELEGAPEGRRLYRVDAHLLALEQRSPELERRLHDALRTNVEDLRTRPFRIEEYTPVLGEDGAVLYYDVTIRP